jgi:hypothetical protein
LSVVICAYTLERWPLCGRPKRPAAERARARGRGCQVPQRGLSAGRNTGVAACTGDVVAFLDDDAAADPTWAAAMLAAYTDETVVGVGGLVVPE